MFDLKYQLKILPDKPGVYIMKSSSGEVIYVGKAKILKNRVRQYFQNDKNQLPKVTSMVSNIAEFEYIVTDTEIEALMLECTLIKKYSPKYNINLKDDKFYPMIKITTNEQFPRVFVTRSFARDGNKYFGPYANSGAVFETIALIKKYFLIRSCKLQIEKGKQNYRPCLNYHIKLCNGPCGNLISKEDYNSNINDIIDLLNGKDDKILKDVEEKMEYESENLNFEKAAYYRDKIRAIGIIRQKQKMTNGSIKDADYINLARDEKDACVQIFFVRDGKVDGREHYILENKASESDIDIITGFIKRFYQAVSIVPHEIFVPVISDENEILEKWLSIKRGSNVAIKIPLKGEKRSLLNMVEKNAILFLDQFKLKILSDKVKEIDAVLEIKELLEFDSDINRIESYDISNIQGLDSVGTMVVFEDGKPKNSDYRRFKIKTVKGADDYSSMREILRRRFIRGIDETKNIIENKIDFKNAKFSNFPELILMDGGLGQVNVALQVLEELNLRIPVAGMVKDNKHRTRGIIYKGNEISISNRSAAFKLLTRIQDETHRFAITYHRTLRDKRTLHSIIDDIPSIGKKRKINLLMKFGSIDSIKKATLEDLLSTPSIDKKSALSILEYFGKNN